MMENSYQFFANKACKYYPCHEGMEEINCLFCYCPMYFLPNCPGKPESVEKNGRKIRKCTGCSFPHVPENYEKVMAVLKKNYFSAEEDGA